MRPRSGRTGSVRLSYSTPTGRATKMVGTVRAVAPYSEL